MGFVKGAPGDAFFCKEESGGAFFSIDLYFALRVSTVFISFDWTGGGGGGDFVISIKRFLTLLRKATILGLVRNSNSAASFFKTSGSSFEELNSS